MTAVNSIWGPAALGIQAVSGSVYALNDLDDALAMIFSVPKSGTITEVGLHCATVTGNPPAYNVGLVTVTASTGEPTTTGYGGSTNTTKDFTIAQWEWITLAVPATAVAGQLAAVYVWPTASAPDAGNCATFQAVAIHGYKHPRVITYSTAWTFTGGVPQGIAVKYNDGSVYGLAITARQDETLESDTTPDEVGALFTLPAAMTCIGAHIGTAANLGNAPFTIKLYDAADTLLGTVVVSDEDSVALGNGVASVLVYWATPVQLSASVAYRLTILADSTTLTITPAIYVFESAASLTNNIMLPEAARWQKTERTNGGAWTDTPAQCPHMALIVTDITFASAPGPGTTTIRSTPAIPVAGVR